MMFFLQSEHKGNKKAGNTKEKRQFFWQFG